MEMVYDMDTNITTELILQGSSDQILVKIPSNPCHGYPRRDESRASGLGCR